MYGSSDRLPGLSAAALGGAAGATLGSVASSGSPHAASSSGAAATASRLAASAMGHISRLCMNPLQANVFLLVNPGPPTAAAGTSAAAATGTANGGCCPPTKPVPDEGAATAFQRSDTTSTAYDSEYGGGSGDKTRIPAHKAILAAASPTFAAMFASGMQECEDGAEVFVPFSLPVMESVLAFVYCAADRCVAGITADTAMEVLDAACFYQLDALKEAAVDTVIELTTSESVLPVLAAAVRYQSERLKDHSIGFIRQHNTDVLRSRYWPLLPLEVAVLLVRETVIDSELNLLRSCIAWCHEQAKPSSDDKPEAANTNSDTTTSTAVAVIKDQLAHFLPFINFTAMTMSEMSEVERLGCIPIDVLYRAFKSHALGGEPTWVPRHGGILLQWEYHGSGQLAVDNNHVMKVSQNFDPVTITAMNRFAAGSHYWYFTVTELRAKHDCLIGIRSQRRKQQLSHPQQSQPHSPPAVASGAAADYDVEIKYEPCCNTVTAIPSSGLRIVRSSECPDSVLGADNGCVIGVCVDFDAAQVRFYDHQTKRLLYLVEAVESVIAPPASSNGGGGDGNTPPAVSPLEAAAPLEDFLADGNDVRHSSSSPHARAAAAIAAAPTTPGRLPTPLFPCATLYHKGNGGVVLSDTTTYLDERAVSPADLLGRRGDSSRPESAMGTPKKMSASAAAAAGSPYASSLSALRSPGSGPSPPMSRATSMMRP